MSEFHQAIPPSVQHSMPTHRIKQHVLPMCSNGTICRCIAAFLPLWGWWWCHDPRTPLARVVGSSHPGREVSALSLQSETPRNREVGDFYTDLHIVGTILVLLDAVHETIYNEIWWWYDGMEKTTINLCEKDMIVLCKTKMWFQDKCWLATGQLTCLIPARTKRRLCWASDVFGNWEWPRNGKFGCTRPNCPFGKNRVVGLVYRLSSFTCRN